MKRKVERDVDAEKETEKNNGKETEEKNSNALQYVFKLCKHSKQDKKRHNDNALHMES